LRCLAPGEKEAFNTITIDWLDPRRVSKYSNNNQRLIKGKVREQTTVYHHCLIPAYPKAKVLLKEVRRHLYSHCLLILIIVFHLKTFKLK